MPVILAGIIDTPIPRGLLELLMPTEPLSPEESSGLPGPRQTSSMSVHSALAVIATDIAHLRRSHEAMDAKIDKLDDKLNLEVKELEATEGVDSAFRNEVKGALGGLNAFGRIATVVFSLLQLIFFAWVGSINLAISNHGERLTHAEDRSQDLQQIRADINSSNKDTAKILATTDQLASHITGDENQIGRTEASLQALKTTVETLSTQLGAIGRSVDAIRPIIQQLQIDDDARQPHKK